MKQVEKILTLTFLATTFLMPQKVMAQYYQPDEEVNQIVLDKQIKGLKESVWKDNYPSDFMVFGPNTQFEFKIIVKNTGNRNLTWIKVTDTLPPTVDYLYGRIEAQYDKTTRQITWKIPEIKPGEQQVTVIGVRTKSKQLLPYSIKESINKACAVAESDASDCDESRFFTNMGTADTPKTLPVTGGNDLISLIGLTMSSIGAAGYFFKKHLSQA